MVGFAPPADLPLRDDIFISAFAVVAFSVIVQPETDGAAGANAPGLTPRSGTGARLTARKPGA